MAAKQKLILTLNVRPSSFARRIPARTLSIIRLRSSPAMAPMFSAFQANVDAYVVSMLSSRLAGKINLERIWLQQDISVQLRQLIAAWAREVNDILHQSANGRMVSEWAKKSECWDGVRSASFSEVPEGIPELAY